MREIVKLIVIIAFFAFIGFAIGHGVNVYEVTSESMEPTIEKGEYVITYKKLSEDSIDNRTIVVFSHPKTGDLIVHRVIYHAEAGEDWTDDIHGSHFSGSSDCSDVPHCPAPYDGYITAGDGNFVADQVGGLPLVKEKHIESVVWKIVDPQKF